MIVTKHVCDKCGSTYVGKECDICKRSNKQMDYIWEQLHKLSTKPKDTDFVDAATYAYQYHTQNTGSAFHKAFELAKCHNRKVTHYAPTYDCTGRVYYDNEPEFLNKKLNIPEYKGETNMKRNVTFEEKQTLRIYRECNEWRDIYTVADTEPTDLFILCCDQNMRVYMRVAMDEDAFLVKDPNMRPVLDVETGCIDMMDKDEKIFIYDPRACRLGVGNFIDDKPHDRS